MTRPLRTLNAALFALTSWLAASPGAASEADVSLALEDVLESLATHYPVVLAERANAEAAQAEARAARGELDTNLTVQGRIAPAGYYDPRRLDVVLEQPTTVLGATLYTGYRLTRGKVAPYYGEQRTLDRGEVRGGVRVPLLQDRALDARRAGLATSDARAESAQESYRELLLELERSAAQAYFAWLSAGQKLQVAEGLVTLAEQRDAQLAELVAHGAVPELEALDNRRAILERKRQRVAARRALEKAALDLSLYLRGSEGTPRVATSAELPDASTTLERPATSPEQAEQRAVAERPGLRAQRAEVRAAEVERALADTRVGPRLDVFGEVSRDFGDADPSIAPTLRPTAAEVGVTFSMPLWLRRARGKLDAADAKLRATRHKATLASDKVRNEVRDAHSQLDAALERVQLAHEVVEAAGKVAAGERERFQLGASTVLFVNLREQQSADAESALIDALAEAQYALVRARTVQGVSALAAR